MKNIPRMSRARRRMLIRLGRRSGDPHTALRFQAIARLGLGLGAAQVATDLDIARSTVNSAAKRFAEHGIGGLADRRRHNGKPKADARFVARLVVVLRRTPEHFHWPRPTWTRELLCLQMEADGHGLVSVATMGRVLSAIGARHGAPKAVVLCWWPRQERERRLAELRALEQRATSHEPVLFEDEVDIHLNPKIGRDWMLRGAQRRVVTPGKNEKFYLAGALDVLTGKLHTTGAPKKNAALFCALLRLLAETYRDARRVHLVLDNYGIHSSVEAQATLVELRGKVVLHFLPPYCPSANRIERVWQDLHANVTRNHRCRTMKRLLANARDYLLNYVWQRALRESALAHRAA